MTRTTLAALTFILGQAGLAETLLVGTQEEYENAVETPEPFLNEF